MSAPDNASSSAPPGPGPAAAPAARSGRRRRSIAGRLLRLLFGGKRALLTLPLMALLLYVGWEVALYQWYRGASNGERTGVVVKVSTKGTPLCRYVSAEMRVGQQAGTSVMGSEAWEFTVDPEYAALIPQLEAAGRKLEPITVKYRQDSPAMDGKPVPPPSNLPWRFCVATSYHAVGLVTR